jgi:hypothetical protein
VGRIIKLTRAKYPILFAGLIIQLGYIIPLFYDIRQREVMIFSLSIIIPLLIIGVYIAKKDNELWKTIVDERTKQIGYLALSYSWLITFFGVFFIGMLGTILKFSPHQIMMLVLFEMLLTMTLCHIYFNFRGRF